MNHVIYTVFDSASGVYDRPFVANSDGSAVRAFGDICMSADHPIGQHPEDYSLYRIGTFDDNNAVIKPEDRICLITGQEAVSRAGKVNGDQLSLLDREVSGSA